MSPRILVALSVLALLPFQSATAFDADLDPTFGTGGKVTVNFDAGPPLSDAAIAVFEGLDGGGTWVIGSASGGSAPNTQLVAITRLNAAGSSIFKRTISLDLYTIVSAAPAPDGGAVVFADGPVAGGADNVILKLTPAGFPDTAFSGDGIERLGLTAGETFDGAVEPDGTIDVLYRRSTGDFIGRRQLTRLSPFGAQQSTRVFDTEDTFSTGKLEVQRDGKLLVALGQDSCALRVLRYSPASQGVPLGLDPTFVPATTTISTGSCGVYPRDVRVDALGRIVVLLSNIDSDVLVRHVSSGAIDSGFGPGGLIGISTSTSRFYAMGIQSDNRVVVGGVYDDGVARQFGLCRYTALGAADTTFSNGLYCTNFRFNGTGGGASMFNRVWDIAIVRGDRIVAAGSMQWAAPADYDFAIAKLKGSNQLFANGFE